MEFVVKSGSPEKQRTACLVVGVFEPRKLSPTGEFLDDISEGALSNIIRRGDIEGKLGQTLLLHNNNNFINILADRILLVGCGRERDFDAAAFRQAMEHSAIALSNSGSTECVSYLSDLHVRNRSYHWKIRYAIEATESRLYRFEQLKSFKELQRRPLRKMVFTVPNRRDLGMAEEALRQGLAIASAIRLTRDLVNLPANICTPAYMAEQARVLAKTYPALQLHVYDQDALQQLKMPALLAMASPAPIAPCFIELIHKPAHALNENPIILIGQGITFNAVFSHPDHPRSPLHKVQMAGAAALLGIMQAVAELNLPLHIVAYAPCVECAHDNRSLQIGNILGTHSGFNVEITHAHAEAQLMLCDVLSYAEKQQPDCIIDVGCLSAKSCVQTFGHFVHCLLGNSSPLLNDLLSAGRTAEDPAWELPLLEGLDQELHSPFADFATQSPENPDNIVILGAFLSRFVGRSRWAHLDICGSAWHKGQHADDYHGASGRPVSLLMQYLFDRIESVQEKAERLRDDEL